MNRLKMMSATLGILSAILAPSLRADERDKMTYITSDQPLQIQGTLLAPGRYMFKLVSPDFDHRTVQIFNADGTRLEATILGNPAYRLSPPGDTQLTGSDPQPGQPAMLQFWVYTGGNNGPGFCTPKAPKCNRKKQEA